MGMKVKSSISLFEIVEDSEKILIRYRGKSFVTVRRSALEQVIFDLSSKTLKKLFFDHFSNESIVKEKLNTSLISRALVLGQTYNKMKKDFYKNPSMKVLELKKTSKEFPHFLKAVELIKALETDQEKFLKAQIDGFKFLNNGAGIFPKPSQLHGIAAQDRYLDSKRTVEHKEDREIYLNQTDRDTPLMENPRFVEKFDKVRNKTSTYQETIYVKKVQLTRTGKNTKAVLERMADFKN